MKKRARVFYSQFALGATLPVASESQIKSEPMLFAAGLDFAVSHGGDLTQTFLGGLPDEWLEDKSFIVDSRTHMLMPGWFPCIPGWHLDDVPRSKPDGQPDHITPAYEAEHAMALWGSSSVTSFLFGDVTLEEPPPGDAVYAAWHHQIEQELRRGALREVPAPTERIVFFDWTTFHRGNPATRNGWRFFIRASRATKRAHANEVRQQVQVYLPAVNAGW